MNLLFPFNKLIDYGIRNGIDKDLTEDEIVNNIMDKIGREDSTTQQETISDSPKKWKSEDEEQIIRKIYNKYNISREIKKNEPIDLVYIFINYSEKEYTNSINKELKERKGISSQIFDDKTQKLYTNLLDPKRKILYDFFINIEMTRSSCSFIRNVFIITPTPHLLNEYYSNDKQVVILSFDELYGDDIFGKLYFRPNNLIFKLNKIKELSQVYLFACSDSLVCDNLRRDYFFRNGIPLAFLRRKKFNNNEQNLKEMEEYEANVRFAKKYRMIPNLANSNQLTIIRKDVVELTKKIFNLENLDNEIIDFLLLQSFTGNFLNLYELELNIDGNGFYRANINNPHEKFNLIKHKKCKFFNLNYVKNIYLFYYIHSFLYNRGSIEQIKNVFLVGDINELRYDIPILEKQIKGLKVIDSNSLKNQPGKFGEYLYVILTDKIEKDNKKYEEYDNIVMEIRKSMWMEYVVDILFFLNGETSGKVMNEEKYKDENFKITFPRRMMSFFEDRFNIPFIKILNMKHTTEDDLGVKTAKIHFKKK